MMLFFNLFPFKKKNNIFIVIIFSLFLLVISDDCKDENCQNCSGNLCFVCKQNFIRFQYQCVKKSKKIKNCIFSNAKEDICVHCEYGCKPENGICKCTLRYILYVIYVLITVTTLSIFLYCLTHNTLAKLYRSNRDIRFRPFNNSVEVNNSNYQFNFDSFFIDVKQKEKRLLKEFNKNRVILKSNLELENMKCYCCKNMMCNLYLNCGCYVCFDCEKQLIKNNICLNCHKKFNSMSQVSCSICLSNKKKLGFFNCQCKMVVCKDCYIKWRKKNQTCPTCRTIIN